METSEEVCQSASPESELIGHVSLLLKTAGIPASLAEVRHYAGAYAFLTQGLKALYAIPGCNDELPALQFAATSSFADWAEKDLRPASAGIVQQYRGAAK